MQNWEGGLSLACLCFLVYSCGNYFYCVLKNYQFKTFKKKSWFFTTDCLRSCNVENVSFLYKGVSCWLKWLKTQIWWNKSYKPVDIWVPSCPNHLFFQILSLSFNLATPGLCCNMKDLLSSLQLWHVESHAGSLVLACKLLVQTCGI